MKKIALRVLMTMLVAAGCTACIHSKDSSFFNRFSLQRLVEENKSHARLECDASGGGGGGIGAGTWGWGSGSKEFHSHKGDGFFCRLKANSVGGFDEAALIAGLRQDVERAITSSGATITDSGYRESASFYFRYALDNVKGRVEISGQRIQDNQYSLKADLYESDR
jgi:hypothetical protein